ncbi:hypothetical protein CW703_01770 [Candidatus Bathyarchaeota archaeon]|nr:MAG: hypothetical protein CW703_01770 [Candidatus Bathyarchaeota archaeon]
MVDRWKGKRVLKSVIIVLFVSLFMLSFASQVEAHMPGAKPPPKFELEPIVVNDGGEIVKITIEEIGLYHNEVAKNMRMKMLKKQGKTDEEIKAIIEKEFANSTGICPCVASTYRAVLLGIKEIWKDEIPKRDDIKIISYLPTPGSLHCLQYITGNCPKVKSNTKGEFHIILPNGTEVKNFNVRYLKKISINNNPSNYRFIITRKSTDESFTADLKDDIFPDDFFDLRKKVKYGVPEKATDEERERFRSEWEEVRDKLLTKPDSALFEGVKEDIGKTIFGIALVLVVLGGIGTVWGARHITTRRR